MTPEAAQSAPPSPEPPQEAATDMQVVGQCPGDQRKLDDVISAEAQNLAVAILVPGESGNDEAGDEKRKKQEHQDEHIERKFREALALQATRTAPATPAQ